MGPQTTYSSAYLGAGDHRPPVPIRPKEQHPWTSTAKFNTRSTAQDSFAGIGSPPRDSCKPIREYEPINWPSKPVTTNKAMFIPHYGLEAKRSPFRPKAREVDGSKFETRSTAQDSFLNFPASYKPRGCIYPSERPYEYSKFDHTSTSRAAFIAHPTMPYVAAKKPVPSMGADGMMA